MEKGNEYNPPRGSIYQRLRGPVRVIYAVALLYICFQLDAFDFTWFHNRLSLDSVAPATESITEGQDDFSWTKITPATHLNYAPCLGKYECARLDVPMDWNSTVQDASRVTIAIMRLPAPVAVTDPRYGGAILINPGGPGGSGTNFLQRAGDEIATIVNTPTSPFIESDGKYFDIISWDPRGVNNTTPRLNCFPDAASSDTFKFQAEANGIDSSSSAAVSNLWARSKALAAGCSEDNEILKHMNTAPVVADMVEIIERHGEWRAKQAQSWLDSPRGQEITSKRPQGCVHSKEAVIERTRWRQGEEKLLYWGYSYGTVIGSTFATLQPHRVGRVVIDGVCDTDDYYHTGWLANLQDTDLVMEHFYEYCSIAGPSRCAMARKNSSTADIKAQIEALVANIKEDPIPVPGNSTRGPEIITYSDMMQMIRMALYKPLKAFPQMADLLADLAYGNGTAFAAFKQDAHKPSCPLQCKNPSSDTEPCLPPTSWETTSGIMCSDGIDVSNSTKDDFRGVLAELYGQSKWMGEVWSTIVVPCFHWKGKAAWTLTADQVGGNTSHPLLLVGNTLDNVTPVRNARKMSGKFPGSVVLQQNSDGHCSTSSPSLCTSKHIRNYFQTGALPAPGTFCEVEELPLIGKTSADVKILSTADATLLQAMDKIADVLGGQDFFGPS